MRLSRRIYRERMNGEYVYFWNLVIYKNFGILMLQRANNVSLSSTIKINNMFFPESLTEIYCDNPGASCNGTKFFTCQQDKTRLEVAFVERRGEAEEVRVRSVRNITVNIGCSCVTSKLRIFKHIASGPEE